MAVPRAGGAAVGQVLAGASPLRRGAAADAFGAPPAANGPRAAALGLTAALLCRWASKRGSRSRRCGGRSQVQRAAFDLDAWRKGFFNVGELENGYYFVEGVDLPEGLRGTYFRNGPGNFVADDGGTVAHELDGDGMVLAISFGDEGGVCVRHRLVQTQGYLRDKNEKRMVSGGIYGTQATSPKLFDVKQFAKKNTANAGVLWWEEKLLALWPFGKPFMVDPGSLGTIIGNQEIGASDLGSALDTQNADVPFGPTPKFCATTGNLVNFGQNPSAGGTDVRFFEFPAGNWTPKYRLPVDVKVPGYTFLSDMAATPRWFIIGAPAVSADGIGASLGKTMPEVLQGDPGGVSTLIFASRDKNEKKEVTVPIDGVSVEEFANAFELDEGRRVILDVVVADSWDVGACWKGDPSQRPRRRLVRYDVDLSTKSFSRQDLCDRHMGFTSVNKAFGGKRHRFVFGAIAHSDSGAGPMAGVAKVDTDSGEVEAWLPGPTEFGGEPLFVPRDAGSGEEDDGFLITVVFDGAAKSSYVAILDARKVSEGPVCRFALEGPVPHGLRGSWAEGMTFTPDEMKRKNVLLRMFSKKGKTWNSVETGFNTLAGGAFFQKQGVRMR